MQQTPPLLSVTITSYNLSSYIGEAIESILAQTFTDYELIIVDDGSSDNSPEIIQGYADRDARIKPILRKENKGFIKSLLECRAAATGKYLVHIDADDWIASPTAFAQQIELLEKNPNISFVYSTLTEYTRPGHKTLVMESFPEDTIVPGIVALEKALEFYIGHTGPIIRRSCYEQVGGYDTSYAQSMDMKHWVDLCATGDVGYIHESLYGYRKHESGMTSAKDRTPLLKEMLSVIDAAFSGPLAAEANARYSKRKFVSNALTSFPMTSIFAGQTKEAWRIYWQGIKLRPMPTLLNKNSIVLVLRTLLGSKLYNSIHPVLSGSNSLPEQAPQAN